MAPETNIELVRAGLEALNGGDLDACIELASPDLIISLAELPEPLHGRDTWREGAAMFRRAFPDVHAEIEDIFCSGDRVAVRLRMRGTHEGEYLGIPPSGRTVSYVSHEFYRIEDGLIAEEWICSDTAGLFQQIA
ncbi:MAG TPA: ester cyclase [Solirubrobacteraceae bacterium]|nr:ester cyclase [Solirubrobacteraceae bacterium]